MKKLFSLVAMMLCVISGWAQSMLESPTYYQIPASPYVLETTPENVKGGYFQKWICTDAASWQTVAAGTSGWYGKWINLNGEPTFAPYDDPTWTAPSADYGFDGMQVRNQDGTGRRLYMFVKNISSVTGYFVANNTKREFMIHVYNEAGELVKEANTVMDGSSNACTVTVDGLDNTKNYKLMIESNNGNCWIQAIKFEGTPSNTAKHGSHVYLEQVANYVYARNLAEGEVVRYKSSIGDEAISGAVADNDPEIPAKGLAFVPGQKLNLRARAFAANGTDKSPTWNVSYELPVPTITADYVAVKSIADALTVNPDAADGSWFTSVKYNEWEKVYSGLENVLWTTTAGDYQYVGKAHPDYAKRETLTGEEVEIPGVTFNRNNTMYFTVAEPSIVKLTAAPMYKNASQETNNQLQQGKTFTIDGVYYTLDDDYTWTVNVEAGTHTFRIPNKPEVGFQMLEIKKGYSAEADGMLDVVKYQAIVEDLTKFLAGKEEYIPEGVPALIQEVMSDEIPFNIAMAIGDAMEAGTKYVSPVDWEALNAKVADIKAQITSNIPVVTENVIGVTRTVDVAAAKASLKTINTVEGVEVEQTYGETTLAELEAGKANETKLMYHGNRNIVVENNQGVAKVAAEQAEADAKSYYGVKFTVPEGKVANIERLVSCFLYDKNYFTTVAIENNGVEVYNSGKLKFNNYYNNNGRCAGDSINVTAEGVTGLTPSTVEKLLNDEVTTEEAYLAANCGWTAGNNLTDAVKGLAGTVEVKLYYFGKASVFTVKDLQVELALADAPAVVEGDLWTPKTADPVAAGTVLVDNDVLKLETVFNADVKALQFSYGEDKVFDNYLQVRVDAAPTADNVTGTEKAGSTPVVVTAKQNGSITVYYRRQAVSNGFTAGDGKDVKLVDQAEPKTVLTSAAFSTDPIVKEDETVDYGYAIQSWNIEAGKTYTLWGRGTTICCSAIAWSTELATAISNATVAPFANGAIYNLAGQKVDANYKGIVIMNGKKVLVK